MKVSVINNLVCVNHITKPCKLRLDPLLGNNIECIEGFLICDECQSKFPIIQGVTIIVKDFQKYVKERIRIYGQWITNTKTQGMKKFLKEITNKLSSDEVTNSKYEHDSENFKSYLWTHYQYSLDDRFLSMFRHKIKPDEIYNKVAHSIGVRIESLGLDIGCAVGAGSIHLAKNMAFVFGIDLSYSFILEARKHASEINNLEFIVCDSNDLPFKSSIFDVIIALNILDRIEIKETFSSINRCIKKNGKLIITDPYDFAINQMKINSNSIRSWLEKSGYEIRIKNKKESFIPWIIKVNERMYLFYYIDYIEATRISN